MICLDTTAIIDIFKGNKELKVLLEETNGPLATTRINYLEIMFGLNFDNSVHKKEESYYDEFFKEILILEIDNSSSKKASSIFWNLKNKGKIIGKFDCVIAGILLSKGFNKIITKNIKHFENIKELKVRGY